MSTEWKEISKHVKETNDQEIQENKDKNMDDDFMLDFGDDEELKDIGRKEGFMYFYR